MVEGTKKLIKMLEILLNYYKKLAENDKSNYYTKLNNNLENYIKELNIYVKNNSEDEN